MQSCREELVTNVMSQRTGETCLLSLAILGRDSLVYLEISLGGNLYVNLLTSLTKQPICWHLFNHFVHMQ